MELENGMTIKGGKAMGDRRTYTYWDKQHPGTAMTLAGPARGLGPVLLIIGSASNPNNPIESWVVEPERFDQRGEGFGLEWVKNFALGRDRAWYAAQPETGPESYL